MGAGAPWLRCDYMRQKRQGASDAQNATVEGNSLNIQAQVRKIQSEGSRSRAAPLEVEEYS